MKVAVLQSNYIPWKGYFDIINDVDMFVFYDDVKYTEHDWRNRNKINTQNGLLWLTVPVMTKGNQEQLIKDAVLKENTNWQRKHYGSLLGSYGKSPFFHKYKDFLEYVYMEKQWTHISQLNQYMIKTIAQSYLGITTKFEDSSTFNAWGTKNEKLLNLLKATNTNVYVSGPAAKDYMIEKDYNDAGIEVIWKDYSGYPQYKQMFEPFEHGVSILDLLFNTGDDAPYYIWGWRGKK